MFLHTVEEKVRLLLNWNSLLDLHALFLTKYVHALWNKPAKWGKGDFSWSLQNSQKPVSPNWVFRWGQGSHGDNFPYLDTCVDVFLDLFHESFLLTSCLMGLLSLVMPWCVGWAISGKAKGKTGQKTRAGWGTWGGGSRVDPHVWGWEILDSPQWPANEWEDLWKETSQQRQSQTLPRGAQSMDKSQWAQAAAKRISGCIYIKKIKKKLMWVFWSTETGPQRGVALHPWGFQELTTKDLQQLILLWS